MSTNTKYTIAEVQQEKLLELKLDIKDAFILTYIREISLLNNLLVKKIDGDRYFWLAYRRLISYLPVLKIKTEDALGRRIAKYEEHGLIKRSFQKSQLRGSLVFIKLEKKFHTLFEINKVGYEDDNLEELKKELGLEFAKDEKSGGQGRKTEWSGMGNRVVKDEKPCLNTPNKYTPKKNTSSSTEKTTATNFETFKNNLLGLLPTELKSINLNTIKNIFNYSNGELELVREALIYMQINSKSMKPNVLVAILKDRDYEIKELSKNKTLSRQDKIQYMLEHLSEKEIESMKEVIRENLGVDGEHLDNHLGNLLCKKYNESEKRVS